MRTSLLCLICGSLMLAAGCQTESSLTTQAGAEAISNVKRGDGLEVRVQIPKRQWTTGEVMAVDVTAVNTTGKPLDLHSPNGAPVLVRLVRQDRMSHEQVRVYPQAATSNVVNWLLPARASRSFKLMVPVEPDWPVAEVLYLSAELNGCPNVNPSLAITVQSGGQK